MPLHQFSNRKKIIFPLVILLYAITLVSLVFWIEQSKPSEPANVTQITFNKNDETLTITGENLPPNFSALLTPNMQRQQATVSSRYTWGKAYNATGADNHIWIANGTTGVLSYNIADPKQPTLEGILDIKKGFRAWDITTHNDTALVAGGSSGLAGLDISKPESPQLKFTMYEDKIIFDSIIKDNTAILLSAREGIIILDISDMNTPTQIGEIPLDSVLRSITQSGDRAFICGVKEGKGQLYVVDITQPRQAKVTTTIELPHAAFYVTEIDGSLLVSMGRNGLYLANTSTIDQTPPPHRIEKISAFGLFSFGPDVFISNGAYHIYHYRYVNGVLSPIKKLATAGRCYDISLVNNHIVACLGEKGFALFDPAKENITPPPNIKKTQDEQLNIIQKNRYFIIHSSQHIDLFTVTPEGFTCHYDTINFTNVISDIAIDHNYAYILLRNKQIHIIALHPKALQRTEKIINLLNDGEQVKKGRIHNIAVHGSNLYVGTRNLGIFIVDHKKLTTSSMTTPTSALNYDQFVIVEDLLYVATRPSGLKIYQLTDKAAPLLIGELQYPTTIQESSTAMAIVVKDGFAFLTNAEKGLLSIDVRNSESPTISDALNLDGSCTRLVLNGDYAYVTNDGHKVTVVDISDPLKMKILCDLPTTLAVTFVDNTMYQLNDIGLYINSPPQPLKIVKKCAQSMRVQLPAETTAGYYDLQLATTQDIDMYSDLLHYSPQQGWSMTREFNIR